MGFGKAISSGLAKYFTFTGRAPRSEYWYFYLFFLLCMFAGGFVDGVLHGVQGDDGEAAFSPFLVLSLLVLFIPLLSVTVRRLHDLDRSGWWWWLGLIPLVGGL